MYSFVRSIRRYYACGMSPATRILSGGDVASYVSTRHAKRWDGDNPPNSARSRDARVAAQYHLTTRSLRSERVLLSSREGRVPLSSAPAIPSIVSRYECRLLL